MKLSMATGSVFDNQRRDTGAEGGARALAPIRGALSMSPVIK